MTPPERPEMVLAGIPGWQDASYRELSGGLNNRTLLVEAEDRRGVLKIDAGPRALPFNSRVAEARIQGAAASVDLAARVLYADATSILTEYQEGEAWDRSVFGSDEHIVALAQTLRRLHALPLTGRTFDAVQAARLYASSIRDADPVIVERCLDVVESMPAPQNLCCCHNDLVAQNIVGRRTIRLLDWEYACDNDPFFDLATIVAHHELRTEQAERLLDAYFDGNGNSWREQLVRQERLYDALHWLWLAARQSDAPGLEQINERLR